MVIFEQVLILFVFIMAGYVLGKRGIVDRSHTRILSGILVYVFLPCMVFKSFANNFNVQNLVAKSHLVMASAAILCVVALLSRVIAALITKNSYERHVYSYSLTIPNFGYMGYALAESMFGEVGLFEFMMFAIPASIYTYTVGFSTLTKRPVSIKGLLNPAMISLVLGCAAGLIGLRFPQIMLDILNKSGACMAPVSMLLAGIVISEFDVKLLIKDKKAYLVTFLRLLVIPLIIGFVLKLFAGEEEIRYAVLFYSMACGMNTIVYPKLVNEECHIGAKLAFLTNIFTCATIPLNLYLLGI